MALVSGLSRILRDCSSSRCVGEVRGEGFPPFPYKAYSLLLRQLNCRRLSSRDTHCNPSLYRGLWEHGGVMGVLAEALVITVYRQALGSEEKASV